MEIPKHSIVNALFVAGFPCWGVGNYLSLTNNFSVGVVFGMLPFLLVLLFYAVDMIYRGRVVPMVNSTYGLTMVFLLMVAASYWVGMRNGYPGLNPVNVSSQSLAMLVPFNAAVVVQVYNRANDRFSWARIILMSIGAVMLLNLVANAAGFRAVGHSFDGRISLPFIGGIYNGAHIIATINIMLLFHLGGFHKRPIPTVLAAAAFGVGLLLMLNINSRLSIMIFFVLVILFASRSVRRVRGLYTISLFTLPLLMSFSLLVYEVLSLPFFRSLLGRVSKADVTTFNGRTYLWEAAGEWLMDDRRGLLFGNGFMGQAHIGLLDFMKRLWEGDPDMIHMHSTFLEVLIDQGIIALVLLYVIIYKGYTHYRKEYLDRSVDAPLFAAFVYLMFIWQIDIFCYGMDMGNPLLFAMISGCCLHGRFVTRQRYALDGSLIGSG